VPAGQAVGEAIELLEGVVATLEGVTDEATARVAVAKLEESAKGMRQWRTKLERLGELPPDAQRAVAEKYQARMVKLIAAFKSEVDRIRQDEREYAIVREPLMQLQQRMGR
jgi:hypothetical protein